MSLQSVFGFEVGELIREKKTGRRAIIRSFNETKRWATSPQGHRVRVPSGEYEVVYQWAEPVEGRKRFSRDNWVLTGRSSSLGFRKQRLSTRL